MILQSIAISKRGEASGDLSAFYELHRSQITALSEAAYSPIVLSPHKATTIAQPAKLIAASPKHSRRRIVFEPEPSRWKASETDGAGGAERPTECLKRRSQHFEVEFVARR
jgi:hypothetical protein